MLKSLVMIGENLKEQYPQIKIQQLYSYPLTGVRLFSHAMPQEHTDFLYLYRIDSQSVPVTTGLQYLVIGELDERFEDVSYINIPHKVNELALIEQVNSILEIYVTWERNLLRATAQGESIQELVKLSRNMFGNPINVYDVSLRILASEGYQQQVKEPFNTSLESGQRYMSEHIVQVSKQNGFFNLVYSSVGAYFFHNYTPPVLVCGIDVKDCRIGFLTIPMVSKKLGDLHLMLAETLAFCLAQALERQMSPQRSTVMGTFTGDFLAQISTGKNTSSKYINYQLNKLGWGRHDTYFVVAIKAMNSEKNSANQLNHEAYQFMLKPFFQEHLMTKIEKMLVMVVHNQSFHSFSPQEKEAFRFFLESNDLQCGCSMEFDCFPEIKNYYLQAAIALNMCGKKDQYYPVALYEDHIVNHVVQNFAHHFEAKHYILPGIRALAQYDKTHGGNLLNTLYSYLLNDRSYAACSEEMFIHKSTLKYRLEKIKSIVGEDCFHADKRMQMLISIRIIRDSEQS